jgi:hypothetical protein
LDIPAICDMEPLAPEARCPGLNPRRSGRILEDQMPRALLFAPFGPGAGRRGASTPPKPISIAIPAEVTVRLSHGGRTELLQCTPECSHRWGNEQLHHAELREQPY